MFYIFTGATELLMDPGKYPGCSGTRNLYDNLSDLRAQVAANQKVLWDSLTSHDNHVIIYLYRVFYLSEI